MSGSSSVSGDTQSDRAAVRILQRYGADPSSTARTGVAVERFFSRLQNRFNPLVGQSGYRALLQAVHRKVAEDHPVLERWPVESTGNPFFGGLDTRVANADPMEVWAGLTALTGEFIRLANSMARQGEMTLSGITSSSQDGSGLEGDMAKGIPAVATDRGSDGPEPTGGDGPSTSDAPGREASRPKRSSQPWRILVMDRDRITCEAMARALDGAKDFRVVAHGMTGAEVEERVKAEDVDFVVASAHLPTDEVMAVCRWLRREQAEDFPHVVVTGLPPDDAVILRFLEAGASAFTMEEFSVAGLRLVLRLLARGESVFPLRLQHLMCLRLSELAELVRDRGLDPDTLSTLTSRESEVLLHLEEGLTNREIAKKLYISEGTVKSHVHQILRKLNVRDRNEAVRLLRLQRAASGELGPARTGLRKKG